MTTLLASAATSEVPFGAAARLTMDGVDTADVVTVTLLGFETLASCTWSLPMITQFGWAAVPTTLAPPVTMLVPVSVCDASSVTEASRCPPLLYQSRPLAKTMLSLATFALKWPVSAIVVVLMVSICAPARTT